MSLPQRSGRADRASLTAPRGAAESGGPWHGSSRPNRDSLTARRAAGAGDPSESGRGPPQVREGRAGAALAARRAAAVPGRRASGPDRRPLPPRHPAAAARGDRDGRDGRPQARSQGPPRRRRARGGLHQPVPRRRRVGGARAPSPATSCRSSACSCRTASTPSPSTCSSAPYVGLFLAEIDAGDPPVAGPEDLPERYHVVREVTDDEAYTGAALARRAATGLSPVPAPRAPTRRRA